MQSRPLTTRKKQSAIVSRETLDRHRGAFERLSALAVLFLSFGGSIAACSGGWAALAADLRLAPVALGVALQLGLTLAEWWYGAGRGVWRYRLALLIDSALTAIGYGPLFVGWLTAYLATHGLGALSYSAAWGIIGLAALAVAWYPERMLIE